MKIFRLSLFNLKKNKREAAAIMFLTLVSAFLLGTFLSSVTNIPKVFDQCFAETGCADTLLRIRAKGYRDNYYDILADDCGIGDIKRAKCLYSTGVQIERAGATTSMNITFVTEGTELKFENFLLYNSLSDDEIAKLSHPIWLPEYFDINDGYKPGDTITFVAGGRKYPFGIAGFYKCGLLADSGYGRKCVISDYDYMLLSSIYDEFELLIFNREGSFDYSAYKKKCQESTSENMEQVCHYWTKEYQKENDTTFLIVLLYLSVFISTVNFAAVMFLIGHKITKDIEEQMQQIGVLEALGYLSHEISLSYVCEYILSGGIGAMLGAIAALLFSPVMNSICTSMVYRRYDCPPNMLRIIAAALIVALLTVAFAVIKAGVIRKIPPVMAFRRGIRTHHFGNNVFPLERLKKSINLRLALKGIFTDIRSNIGVGVCIVLAGVAILFSVSTYNFFVQKNAMQTVLGAELSDECVNLMNGVDADGFCNALRSMPEVRKVNRTFGRAGMISVKDSDEPGNPIVYDDYNETEYIHTKYGRSAVFDNEIMITLKRSVNENRHVGDSIVIIGDSGEKSYIIAGIVPSMVNNRMDLYFTTEGYIRVFPNARPDTADIYLQDGTDRKEFEEKLTALYGANVKDTAYSGNGGGTLEERIRAAADDKMATLISRYGVTDVDYAIKIGDTVIKGNSSKFVIKELSSPAVELETTMVEIGDVTKLFCLGAVIFAGVIVAVILGIISVTTVKRQRRELGIMKSMGYTSKDLMIQIALRILPTALVSAVIAYVLASYINKVFWLEMFGVENPTNVLLMASAAAGLVLFCLVVSYVSAGNIRKISVTELVTE